MDTFKVQDMTSEKANSSSRHGMVKKFTTFVRFVEVIFFFSLVFSRSCNLFSTYNLFSISSDYLSIRIITTTLLRSPIFVFFTGNAIILVLFLISGRLPSSNKTTDFHEEYLKKCRRDHETICRDQKLKPYHHAKKTIRRSQSESTMTDRQVLHETDDNHQVSHNLKRCTSAQRFHVGSSLYTEEKMSNDEFRNKVEAFIARQQMFLKEEEEYYSLPSDVYKRHG